MWWQTMIVLVLVLVFPKKVMFFIRAGYCLQIFPLFSVIVRIWTVDDIQGLCSDHAIWFSGMSLHKLEGSVPIIKDKKIMILGNHRNFCDFIIHDIITEYKGNYLSRALVGFVFPFMGLISVITDSMWYFVRGSGQDLESFFLWVDSKFSNRKTSRIHLVVYPEGHRNLKKEPLPLKSGMIRYAFSRKLPIQMFMCSGYDEVLNEKKFSAKLGKTEVKYKVYEPIFTDQYLNFDSLMGEVRTKFLERFDEVHNTKKLT